MTDTITAIKKALEGVTPVQVNLLLESIEGNAIISPTDDYAGTYFTVIGCGDKQDDLGRLIALSVNSMPGLLTTLESLQRENERYRAALSEIATNEEYRILTAEEAQTVAQKALSSTGDTHGN